MKRNKLCFPAVCLLFGLLGAGSASELGYERAINLDRFFRDQMVNHRLTALSTVLIRDQQICWMGNYGVRDLDSRQPIGPDTLFHLGSLSKTITLATFLHLWEKRSLDLDADINPYLPFPVRHPDFPEIPISFRMLITNTAGIGDFDPLPVYAGTADPSATLERALLDRLCPGDRSPAASGFLDQRPGGEVSEGTLAYVLLGYLVETISGQPFAEYCETHILSPLVMSQSTFIADEINGGNSACRFYTSTREFANFLRMLVNHGELSGRRILAERTVDTMLELQNLPGKQRGRIFKAQDMALLWNVSRIDSVNFYHLFDSGDDFVVEVFISPDYQVAGLVFIKGRYPSVLDMRQSLSDIEETLLSTIHWL